MAEITVGGVKLIDTHRGSTPGSAPAETPTPAPETKSYVTAEGTRVYVQDNKTIGTVNPSDTYEKQVSDYMSIKAGTYGQVSVPTSTLVRASNEAINMKNVYGITSEGQKTALTEQQKTAIQLQTYFEGGTGNYGELGREQAKQYYASQSMKAPEIESVADRPIARQEFEQTWFTPTEETKQRVTQMKGEAMFGKGYDYEMLPGGQIAPKGAIGSVPGGGFLIETQPEVTTRNIDFIPSELSGKNMMADALSAVTFMGGSKAVQENIRQKIDIKLSDKDIFGSTDKDIIFATTPEFRQTTDSFLYKFEPRKQGVIERAEERYFAIEGAKKWQQSESKVKQAIGFVGEKVYRDFTPENIGIALATFSGVGALAKAGMTAYGFSEGTIALTGKTATGIIGGAFVFGGAYEGYEKYEETGKPTAFAYGLPDIVLGGLGIRESLRTPKIETTSREFKLNEKIDENIYTQQQRIVTGEEAFKLQARPEMKDLITSASSRGRGVGIIETRFFQENIPSGIKQEIGTKYSIAEIKDIGKEITMNEMGLSSVSMKGKIVAEYNPQANEMVLGNFGTARIQAAGLTYMDTQNMMFSSYIKGKSFAGRYPGEGMGKGFKYLATGKYEITEGGAFETRGTIFGATTKGEMYYGERPIWETTSENAAVLLGFGKPKFFKSKIGGAVFGSEYQISEMQLNKFLYPAEKFTSKKVGTQIDFTKAVNMRKIIPDFSSVSEYFSGGFVGKGRVLIEGGGLTLSEYKQISGLKYTNEPVINIKTDEFKQPRETKPQEPPQGGGIITIQKQLTNVQIQKELGKVATIESLKDINKPRLIEEVKTIEETRQIPFTLIKPFQITTQKTESLYAMRQTLKQIAPPLTKSLTRITPTTITTQITQQITITEITPIVPINIPPFTPTEMPPMMPPTFIPPFMDFELRGMPTKKQGWEVRAGKIKKEYTPSVGGILSGFKLKKTPTGTFAPYSFRLPTKGFKI